MMMMELVGMMMQAQENGDAFVDFYGDALHFTVNDFEGFDEDWSEVDHEFVNAELVEAIEDALDEMADEVVGDFYVEYHFGDAVVELGYTSYDI